MNIKLIFIALTSMVAISPAIDAMKKGKGRGAARNYPIQLTPEQAQAIRSTMHFPGNGPVRGSTGSTTTNRNATNSVHRASVPTSNPVSSSMSRHQGVGTQATTNVTNVNLNNNVDNFETFAARQPVSISQNNQESVQQVPYRSTTTTTADEEYARHLQEEEVVALEEQNLITPHELLRSNQFAPFPTTTTTTTTITTRTESDEEFARRLQEEENLAAQMVRQQLIPNVRAGQDPHATASTATPKATARNTGARGSSEQQQGASQECTLCLESRPVSEFVTLECSHVFCRECLQRNINIAMSDNNSSTLRCPNPQCLNGQERKELSEADLRAITRNNRGMVERFTEMKTRELLNNDSANIKHCKTPNCPGTFFTETNEQRFEAWCRYCNHNFCSRCFEAHPMNISCEQAEAQIARAQNDPNYRANEEWVRRQTKPCPSCHKPIQKNEGCNHMTCDRYAGGCGYQFCWLCMRPWSMGPGTGHDSFYTCSNVDQNNGNNDDLGNI